MAVALIICPVSVMYHTFPYNCLNEVRHLIEKLLKRIQEMCVVHITQSFYYCLSDFHHIWDLGKSCFCSFEEILKMPTIMLLNCNYVWVYVVEYFHFNFLKLLELNTADFAGKGFSPFVFVWFSPLFLPPSPPIKCRSLVCTQWKITWVFWCYCALSSPHLLLGVV